MTRCRRHGGIRHGSMIRSRWFSRLFRWMWRGRVHTILVVQSWALSTLPFEHANMQCSRHRCRQQKTARKWRQRPWTILPKQIGRCTCTAAITLGRWVASKENGLLITPLCLDRNINNIIKIVLNKTNAPWVFFSQEEEINVHLGT